jgi:hypothetical protein
VVIFWTVLSRPFKLHHCLGALFFFFFFFQVNLVGLQPPSPFTFSLVVEVMSLGLYQDSKHRRQVALETQFARQA